MAFFPLILVFISTFLHAGWNLLARQKQGQDIFLPVLALISVVGVVPALLAELLSEPILPAVWLFLLLAGVFQALYYLGLLRGYHSGHFTVVYPVARSLPVLVLAMVDVAQGRPPSAWGWLGMMLISLGCLLAPLESWRGFSWQRYWNVTTVWILVTATGMVGYTLVDRAAAQLMSSGLDTAQSGIGFAVRYGLFESITALCVYWLLLKSQRSRMPPLTGADKWKVVIPAAVFMFGAYSLVLWAYQLAEQVSYIVALRQFSIVIGVVAAAVLFHEPAPRWRISMALVIVSGVLMISVGG
jgi:drug/metabolite transporter (DMT)-like permease